MEVQIASRRHQVWSLWRPRFNFLKCCWWQAYFFDVFGGWQKAGRQIKQIWFWACRNRGTGKNRTLSSSKLDHQLLGSGCFSWHYIPLSDNAWPQLVSSDFGAHWILKGSQNLLFCIKSTWIGKKWRPRAVLEKTWNYDGRAMRKGGALKCKKTFFGLCIVQSQRSSRSRNLMESETPTGVPNPPKLITLGPSDQIFEI